MKVAFLLVLCLAAGSQANFFDDLKSTFQNIGNALTTTLHAVGDQAKVVGTSLLSAAKEQGSQLASQALQSLLMGTMSALQHPDTTSTGTKRSLSELLEQSKPLTDAAKMIVEEKMDKLSAVLNEALDRLKGLSSQLTDLPAAELKKKVDQILVANHIVSDDIQSELVSDLTKLFGHVLSHHPSIKRSSFTDALSSIGSGLTNFFQPRMQAAQQVVCDFGQSLLQTASAFQTLATGTDETATLDSSSALAHQGSQLTSQALQSLLMGTMSALQHPDTTSTGTKRSLSELLEQSKPLTDAAKMIVEEKIDKLSAVLNEALDRLKGLSSQLTDLPAAELKKKVDQILVANHIVSDDIQSELVSDLTKLFGHVLSHHPSIKRSSFTDALSSIGGGLTNFFQPRMQAAQQVVCDFGQSLLQTASAFQTLATGTDETATLGSSSALAQHGQNALSALKDTVSDILQQTLTNMQPHIVKILQHGSQALTETLTHTGTSSETASSPQ